MFSSLIFSRSPLLSPLFLFQNSALFQVITVLARAFTGLLCNNDCKNAVPGGSPDGACYFITRHATPTVRQDADTDREISTLEYRKHTSVGISSETKRKTKDCYKSANGIKMFSNAYKIIYFFINKLLCDCADDVNLMRKVDLKIKAKYKSGLLF